MMTGGSLHHSTIASNLWTTLRAKLRGTGCRPFRGDAKVLANQSARYPDLSVTGSPIAGGDEDIELDATQRRADETPAPAS
jgi:Uma2 family endonuclease